MIETTYLRPQWSKLIAATKGAVSVKHSHRKHGTDVHNIIACSESTFATTRPWSSMRYGAPSDCGLVLRPESWYSAEGAAQAGAACRPKGPNRRIAAAPPCGNARLNGPLKWSTRWSLETIGGRGGWVPRAPCPAQRKHEQPVEPWVREQRQLLCGEHEAGSRGRAGGAVRSARWDRELLSQRQQRPQRPQRRSTPQRQP